MKFEFFYCPVCGRAIDKSAQYEKEIEGGHCKYCGEVLISTGHDWGYFFKCSDVPEKHDVGPDEEVRLQYVYDNPKFDPEKSKYREEQEAIEADAEFAYNMTITSYGAPPGGASNVPKCPICGSTNLGRITAAAKVGKIAMFGIFGMGDNGKTWKCRSCGSRF